MNSPFVDQLFPGIRVNNNEAFAFPDEFETNNPWLELRTEDYSPYDLPPAASTDPVQLNIEQCKDLGWGHYITEINDLLKTGKGLLGQSFVAAVSAWKKIKEIGHWNDPGVIDAETWKAMTYELHISPLPFSIKALYQKLNLQSQGLSPDSFRLACNGFRKLEKNGQLKNNKILSIIDFSQSSKNKRFYIIDMLNQTLLMQSNVAHGINSGSKEWATTFSNKVGSNQSSLGFYVTLGTYNGKHGRSLKLEGKESGFNDQAYRRHVVVHSAAYVKENQISGRSNGCPAVPGAIKDKLVDIIKDGSCMFLYFPDPAYLSKSLLAQDPSFGSTTVNNESVDEIIEKYDWENESPGLNYFADAPGITKELNLPADFNEYDEQETEVEDLYLMDDYVPAGYTSSIPSSRLDGLTYSGKDAWMNDNADNYVIRKKVYQQQVSNSQAAGNPYTYQLDKTQISEVDNSGEYLLNDAAVWMDKLLAAARAALAGKGVTIQVRSGYRTAEEQFDNWVKSFPANFYWSIHSADRTASDRNDINGIAKYIAKNLAAPGFSNHNHGLAVDFNSTEGSNEFRINTNPRDNHKDFWIKNSLFWAWLNKNASAYHFYPYLKEPWHWEFKSPAVQTGTDTATTSAAGGASLPSPSSVYWKKKADSNKSYAFSLHWDKNIEQISDLLLKTTGNSNKDHTTEDFAKLVAVWQKKNGFSEADSDGVIGPTTWRKMSAQLTAPATGSVSVPALDWEKKATSNKSYAAKLGWSKYIQQISDLLLKTTGQANTAYSSEDFAKLVWTWQTKNGITGDDADGVMGTNTWKKMSSQLGIVAVASTSPGINMAICDKIQKYSEIIERVSSKYAFNPNIARGIIFSESRGNSAEGKGGTGYKGLMQADTTDDQLDPETSIETGIKKVIEFRDKILAPILSKMGVDTAKIDEEIFLRIILCSYNAGPVTVIKTLKYAIESGNWENWFEGAHYKRALLFTGAVSRYDSCGTTGLEQANKDLALYRYKGKAAWRTLPDHPKWEEAIKVISPLLRCWIETKYNNTPGYLANIIAYYKYFESVSPSHEMEYDDYYSGDEYVDELSYDENEDYYDQLEETETPFPYNSYENEFDNLVENYDPPSWLEAAIQGNQREKTILGWGIYEKQINELITPAGKLPQSRDEKSFAYAVAAWQQQNGVGMGNANGIIDIITWGKMKKMIKAPRSASPICDMVIAVPAFEISQRQKIDPLHLLSASENKKAIAWNDKQLKTIKVDPKHILTDLQRYVDLGLIKQEIEKYNKLHPTGAIDPGTGTVNAVFAEAMNQFQRKIYVPRDKDHIYGETKFIYGLVHYGSLHSLGITDFSSGRKLTINDCAKKSLEGVEIKLNGKDCNKKNWGDFTYNPSFIGFSFNNPVHYLLIARLRVAEEFLLRSSRFSGDNLVDMAVKFGLNKNTEQHKGGRTNDCGMHTLGLAVDIDHANSPWIGAGFLPQDKEIRKSWRDLGTRAAREKKYPKKTHESYYERYTMHEILEKASGLKLHGDKITVYLDDIGKRKGADTYSAYDELKQRSDQFKDYISKPSNAADLSYWKRSATFHYGKAANGFLSLDRDLVYALRQVGNLAWGAIDFGAGEGGDGDIMHFDLRTYEPGFSHTNGTAVKTHPLQPQPGKANGLTIDNEYDEEWDQHESYSYSEQEAATEDSYNEYDDHENETEDYLYESEDYEEPYTAEDYSPEYETQEEENISWELSPEIQHFDVDPQFGSTHYLNVSVGGGLPAKTGAFVSAGFNGREMVDIVVFLHGHMGDLVTINKTTKETKWIPDPAFQKGGIEYYWQNYSNIREYFRQQSPNAILIAPTLGSHSSTQYGKLANENEFERFVSACLWELKKLKKVITMAIPYRIVLAAHSGGGNPMGKILAQKNGLNGKIAEVWGFDCLYGKADGQWIGNYKKWAASVASSRPPRIFYHYWAKAKTKTPAVLGEKLQALFPAQVKNIDPGKVVEHRDIIEHAWLNEINKRPFLDPFAILRQADSLSNESFEDSEDIEFESAYNDEIDFEDYDEQESIFYNYEDLLPDWTNAVNQNRYYAGKLGWNTFHEQVNDFLLPYAGLQNVSLDEEAFAQAVAAWQRKQGFSATQSDGIIGPHTWGILKPLLAKNSVSQPAPSPATLPATAIPPSIQNIFDFNRWHAQNILNLINTGVIGVNTNVTYNPKIQLENIVLGNQVLSVDPRNSIIQVLPLIYHIAEQARINNYKQVIIGSFIRKGTCSGHCRGRCIDINFRGGNFENPGSVQMVTFVLDALLSLPAQYQKKLGFGLPLQNDYFGHRTDLSKFSPSVSPSYLINKGIGQLISKLGIVFPDNDNHLHIQVKWI